MTLNQLKEVFYEFGADHYMINTCVYCLPEQVDRQDFTDGFLMWFYNKGVSVSGTAESAEISVAFMDVVSKDLDNEKDALSDSDKLVQDFCAYLDGVQYDYGFQFQRSVEASNFIHRAGSDWVGLSLDVKVSMPHIYDYCEVAQ